jgi:hypothetical protein
MTSFEGEVTGGCAMMRLPGFTQNTAVASAGHRVYPTTAPRAATNSDDEHRRVAGYYALAAGSVAPATAPQRIAQRAGRYHQPVVILTRLGVDLSRQGLAKFDASPTDPLHLFMLLKDLRRR